MEGAGSRLGRASSRYGQVASAPVFSGPVRKWKRQWVSSQPNNGRSSGGGNGRNNTATSLFLFKWTPLPPDDDSVNPPKRKLRYAPVVNLEEKKRKIEVQDKSSKLIETPSSEDAGDDFEKEIEGIDKDRLGLTGKRLDLDLFGDNNSDTDDPME